VERIRPILVAALPALIAAGIGVQQAAAATVNDARFGEIALVSGLVAPTAVAVAADGRLFVAEKAGKVMTAMPGARPTQLLDISDHVNNFSDRGLLGIGLDRDFARNGYLYLLYANDPNPRRPDTSDAVTSLLTRVTVRGGPRGPTALGRDPRERVILGAAGRFGTCPPPANTLDCMPAGGQSHSGDTVRVDPRDGTLWVSNGDGAGDSQPDPLALHAADPRSYSGKILHIDRNGRGLPGHPFCPQDTQLSDVCTKVYAAGFRNPFRMTLDPVDGSLYAGDVGWFAYEEVDRVLPGGDYGWPCYEGALPDGSVVHTVGYSALAACQPLYQAESDPFHPITQQPLLAYGHDRSSAVVAGPRYRGRVFPSAYRGDLFYGDFDRAWIRYVSFDSAGRVSGAPRTFARSWYGVDLQQAPDGNLIYVDLPEGAVKEIVYAPRRRAPRARPTASPSSGGAPLTVDFDAHAVEPGGAPVFCFWDFADGSKASGCAPRHTFRRAGDYSVFLRVSDGFKSRDRKLEVRVG
jgi:glucose/arabinose dehydrogenase